MARKRNSGSKKKRGRPPKATRQSPTPIVPLPQMITSPSRGENQRREMPNLIDVNLNTVLNEELVTPTRAAVSPTLSDPTTARLVETTELPVSTGGAARSSGSPVHRLDPTARRLDLQDPPVVADWEEEDDKIQEETDVEVPIEEEDGPVDSYANVLKGNRLAVNGLVLEYEAPATDENGLCVCFTDEELEEETNEWMNSIVFYVLGAEHSFIYMEQFVAKTWGKTAKPTLHQAPNGFFIAKFSSQEECEQVMEGGPYSLKSQPIIMSKWSEDFEYKKVKLTKAPI
ncbi:hypothetical protein OROGR_002199 [Orobanche gracilis]